MEDSMELRSKTGKEFQPTIAFRVPAEDYERLKAIALESGDNLSVAARKVVKAGLEKVDPGRKAEED